MEERLKVQKSKERDGGRPNRTSCAERRREVLLPQVVSFAIAPDWSIDVDLSIARQGYPSMTPVQDISIALTQGTYDDISSYSIRDRMRYVDHAFNDVISLVYLFMGPRRTDAFYEQQASASVPRAISRIEDILTVLKSIDSRPPAPPVSSGQGPRFKK